MDSTTFTVRVDSAAKERLESLSRSTGRSRSFLAAEAIEQYLDVNEWQVAGIKAAIGSIEENGAVSHGDVRAWVASWDGDHELARPKPKKS
jgi:RHH-type transcriptional regulator, rel operon repressor / antitoxin RelB